MIRRMEPELCLMVRVLPTHGKSCNLPSRIAHSYRIFNFLAIKISSPSVSKPLYLPWNGGIARVETVALEVPFNLTAGTNLRDGEIVSVCLHPNINEAEEVYLDPLTKFDWDIVQTQGDYIESFLLRSVSLVHIGQNLTVDISQSLRATLLVQKIKYRSGDEVSFNSDKISTYSEVQDIAKITNATSLVIAPFVDHTAQTGRNITNNYNSLPTQSPATSSEKGTAHGSDIFDDLDRLDFEVQSDVYPLTVLPRELSYTDTSFNTAHSRLVTPPVVPPFPTPKCTEANGKSIYTPTTPQSTGNGANFELDDAYLDSFMEPFTEGDCKPAIAAVDSAAASISTPTGATRKPYSGGGSSKGTSLGIYNVRQVPSGGFSYKYEPTSGVCFVHPLYLVSSLEMAAGNTLITPAVWNRISQKLKTRPLYALVQRCSGSIMVASSSAAAPNSRRGGTGIGADTSAGMSEGSSSGGGEGGRGGGEVGEVGEVGGGGSERGGAVSARAVLDSSLVELRWSEQVRPSYCALPASLRRAMNLQDFSRVHLTLVTRRMGRMVLPYGLQLRPIHWYPYHTHTSIGRQSSRRASSSHGVSHTSSSSTCSGRSDVDAIDGSRTQDGTDPAGTNSEQHQDGGSTAEQKKHSMDAEFLTRLGFMKLIEQAGSTDSRTDGIGSKTSGNPYGELSGQVLLHDNQVISLLQPRREAIDSLSLAFAKDAAGRHSHINGARRTAEDKRTHPQELTRDRISMEHHAEPRLRQQEYRASPAVSLSSYAGAGHSTAAGETPTRSKGSSSIRSEMNQKTLHTDPAFEVVDYLVTFVKDPFAPAASESTSGGRR